MGGLPGSAGIFVRDVNSAGQVAGYATLAGSTHWTAFAGDLSGLRDIGALGATELDFVSSQGLKINESGQVIGNAWLPSGAARGWRYSGGHLQTLGTLGGNYSLAQAINAGGTVAGTSYTLDSGLRSAFIHDTAGMTNLGQLGGDYLEVLAINDRGTVVGTGDPGVTAEGLNVSRAYASIAGQVTALQGSALSHSFATGLNNHDEIVGRLRTPSTSEEHAFVALPDLRWGIPTVFDIHRRVSLGGPNSGASAINDRGDIVGWADVAGGQTSHAFLLPSDGGVVRDLGTLGGNWSAANEVNALGQVLGESTLADGTVGWFVYRDGQMLNLADSLAGVYGVLGEPTVLFATLSDAGHVAGTVRTADGDIRSFLLSPVPEPQAATLLLLGLAALRLARSGRRHRAGAELNGHPVDEERRS